MIEVVSVMPGFTCGDARALSLRSVNEARMEAMVEYADACRRAYIERLRREFREWCESMPRELNSMFVSLTGLHIPAQLEECVAHEDLFARVLVRHFPFDGEIAMERLEEQRRVLSYETGKRLHFTVKDRRNESQVQDVVRFLNESIHALRVRMRDDTAKIDRVSVEIIAAVGGPGVSSLSEIRRVVAVIENAIKV